jgi:hypothetical protein
MSQLPSSRRPEVSAALLSSDAPDRDGAALAPPAQDGGADDRPLSAIARAALAEAHARRQALAAHRAPAEIGGRAGPDPVRYGDWENGGIASDF